MRPSDRPLAAPDRVSAAAAVPDAPLEAAYAILAFTMNRAVIDHMLRSARRFGGDYERLILWGTVAHLNIAHLMPPGSLPSSLLDECGNVPDAVADLRPVLLRDLAQITGIARETARRKLASLEADGWLRRTRAGWVMDVERTDTALRPFTLESIRRFLRSMQVMQAALDDASRIVGKGVPPGDAAPAPAPVSGSRTARSAAIPRPARTKAARRS
ncbi:MAG: helix-turn-helix domain-containing protein [Burkholderiales bacterium]|jgi:hypothetical protein